MSVGEDDTLARVDEHAGAPWPHLRICRNVARAGGALRLLALAWRGIRCCVGAAFNGDADHRGRYLLEQRGERRDAARLLDHGQRHAGISSDIAGSNCEAQRYHPK